MANGSDADTVAVGVCEGAGIGGFAGVVICVNGGVASVVSGTVCVQMMAGGGVKVVVGVLDSTAPQATMHT